MQYFDHAELKHIVSDYNSKDDELTKLASTKKPRQHHTIIKHTFLDLSISGKECKEVTIEQAEWMAPILAYLKEGILLENKKEAQKLKIQEARYTTIAGELYRKGFSATLLSSLQRHNQNTSWRRSKRYMWDAFRREINGNSCPIGQVLLANTLPIFLRIIRIKIQ